MFKRILVPLDGSRFSSTALKYAVDVAEHYKAQIILMQAVVPATPTAVPATPVGTLSPVTAELAVQSARLEDRENASKAKRYLQRKAREVSRRGIECSYRITRGDPARSIIRLCRQEKVNLVTLSSHSKGGLKRAILGSVTDQLVRESKVPVLLIRPGRR